MNIDESQMEELARILLSCKELRAEFANQVSSLTLEAKRGLESESSQAALGNTHAGMGNEMDRHEDDMME